MKKDKRLIELRPLKKGKRRGIGTELHSLGRGKEGRRGEKARISP